MKPAHQNLWQKLRLNCTGLSLVFFREADRWAHRVVANANANEHEEIIFLTSCEGDANDNWPPSPPLQDLDPHELAEDRLAILGVGKSGHSHWSASFESGVFDSTSIDNPHPAAASKSGLDNRVIRIELACLIGEQAGKQAPRLGSRYKLADHVQGIQTETGAIHLLSVRPAKKYELIIAPLSGNDWGSELQVCGNELFMQPTQMRFEARKPTRWGCSFRFRS